MITPRAGTITCPDCGLVLQGTSEAASSNLEFEMGDWRKRCKRLGLDSPLWCLVQCAGKSGQQLRQSRQRGN
jgi:hypothetical protein